MGLAQLGNTIGRIYRAEHVSTASGLARHLAWRYRRLRGRFPVQLPLSHSILQADWALGVAALVNCMGMYDYNNMTLIQRTLGQFGGSLLDIGANIGSYTLVASETGQPIIAVEPHPAAFGMLRENVRRNKRPNVTLLQTAASDHCGELLFSDERALSLNQVLKSDATRPTITVPCSTADALCQQLGHWPTIVKIDVEGHEAQVLRGFTDGLSHVDLLIVEDGHRSAVQRILRDQALEGPLYYHHRKQQFNTTPQPAAEDPVYLNPRLREQLS